MPPTHPLELAEIVSLVVAYLPPRSLPAYARVSKTWYQACVPFIWNAIDLKKLHQPVDHIQIHSHLVKSVNIGRLPQEYVALRFPNLESLSTGAEYVKSWCTSDSQTTQFIMEHTTVSTLELRALPRNPSPALWDALIGFRNLIDLTLSSTYAFGVNADKFWHLCTRLQRLLVIMDDWNTEPTLPQEEYPSMKELKVLGCGDNISVFKELLRRCPHLSSIQWFMSSDYEEPFVSDLVELLEARALPNLEHLETETSVISNELFTRLLQNMPRITSLYVDFSRDAFEMDFAPLLRPHFSNLRVLLVDTYEVIMIPLAQEVMSSCPMLEKLRAPFVEADVVVAGRPWVCSRLEDLEISFCFQPLSTDQPLIFDRLSKLTRLEELDLAKGRILLSGHEPLDLRIENGLEKLSTLRLLHTVRIPRVNQRMGHKEVDWILEHWKDVKLDSGELNVDDPEVNQALQERLKEHGILK